jgi:hypothetical protein
MGEMVCGDTQLPTSTMANMCWSDGKVIWVEDRDHIANCQFRINALFRIVTLLAPKKARYALNRMSIPTNPATGPGAAPTGTL